MKTQYYTAATLDGFIAGPDNSLEWLFQFDQGPDPSYPPFIREVGALAMGSTTYEWILNYMNADPEKPTPWEYEQPAWVFTSRSLPGVPGADIRFVRGDVRPVHRDMVQAAEGKNIWIVGGGDLAGQFHDHGLLDEIIVTIAAVTLGAGAPLLPRVIAKPPLKLISVRQMGDFAELRYEVSSIRPSATLINDAPESRAFSPSGGEGGEGG
jgi:dihydrofolate reductase